MGPSWEAFPRSVSNQVNTPASHPQIRPSPTTPLNATTVGKLRAQRAPSHPNDHSQGPRALVFISSSSYRALSVALVMPTAIR